MPEVSQELPRASKFHPTVLSASKTEATRSLVSRFRPRRLFQPASSRKWLAVLQRATARRVLRRGRARFALSSESCVQVGVCVFGRKQRSMLASSFGQHWFELENSGSTWTANFSHLEREWFLFNSVTLGQPKVWLDLLEGPKERFWVRDSSMSRSDCNDQLDWKSPTKTNHFEEATQV